MNLNMLLATIPDYKSATKKKAGKSEGGEDEDLTNIADFLNIKK